MHDITVVGGGIIGLACAIELRSSGATVRIFERGELGAEATSAAAGMLAPRLEAQPGDTTMYTLGIDSLARYGDWVAGIEERAGIRVGYRVDGGLQVAWQADDLDRTWAESTWQRESGAPIERLTQAELRDRFPAIAEGAAGAIHYTDQAQVEPRRLTRALVAAAREAGIEITAHCGVHRIAVRHDRASGVVTENGTHHTSDLVVVCGGAWSALLRGVGLVPSAIEPVRGQMLSLDAGDAPFEPFVWSDGCYIVPRRDGRIVVGSTTERVGFDRSVTAEGIEGLLAGVRRAVPSLGKARLTDTWAGLRPGSQDGLPLIGPLELDGLYLASGHYRNGILLAPLTAAIVAAQVRSDASPIDGSPFDPQRFA